DGNPLWYKEKGLYGFKNSDGSVLISPRYKDVLAPFSEGIAVVKTTNGENAGIDENGRVLFTTPFEDIRPFQYGVAEYRRNVNRFKGSTFLGIVAANSVNSKKIDEYGAYSTVYHGIKRGFIDRNGEIIIDSKNDLVYPMTPYGAFVKNGGLTSFISPKGKVIIAPGRYDIEDVDTEDGYAVLEDDGLDKEGLFDLETGTQLMGFYHDEITLLGHGRAVIEKGKQQYLFDIENDRVITALPAGVDLMPFNDETVTWMYKKGTYYGIIDEDGHILYEDTKDPLTRAGQFRHGLAPAKKGKKWGVIRPDGTWLVKPAYDDIGLL
ncbi:MAG: WG repeat-containing protein, partial [Dialister sp.]|nr:WG repeat-containing protein [Dialister sp.]